MSSPEFTIRCVELNDAGPRIALDRKLAEDGRGMVYAPHQVDSEEDERLRIEAFLAAPGLSIDLVAVLNTGRVIANAKIRQFQPALCQHVGLIALGVDPEFQDRGIGRIMMDELLKRAAANGLLRLELYVRQDNPRAIRLYESLGFKHEGVRKSFTRLANGSFVDDLIMAKLHKTAV